MPSEPETITTVIEPTPEPEAEPEPPNEPEAETVAEAAATAAVEAAATAESAAAEAATSAESAQASSSLISERDALAEQTQLLRDNLELVFRRIDQLARVLNGTLEPFRAAMQDMQTASDAMQLVINRQDEQQEQLAVGLAALAQVTMELTALKAARSNARG